ncbi:hypothetical protein [Streptomyces sp. NPDC002952]|uniref:hypothetical protein n=1 Tax=Streptomyces sp. NPDC002952 TaxID=3364673 RepID=UPI0036921B64
MAGAHGPYDAVVVTSPPHATRSVLGSVPWAGGIVELLGQHAYYPTTITLHGDPVYMPARADHWALQTAAVDGVRCEGSVRLASFPHLSDVQLFKSWTSGRRRQPQQPIAGRDFLHPLSPRSHCRPRRR